jgi:hypothetical protein
MSFAIKQLKSNLSIALLSIFCLTQALQAQSCMPVLDGATLFAAYECLNDSSALVVDSTKADVSGWQYSYDSGVDGVSSGQVGGGDFEMYGLAIRETDTEVVIVMNGNMPIQGVSSGRAADNNIGWGDLFIDFGDVDFLTTHNLQSLYAIRFAGKNDSNADSTGVFAQVDARSVTAENSGFRNWSHYESYVSGRGKLAELGDFGARQSYYASNVSLNVINSYHKIGELEFVSMEALQGLKYNFEHFEGEITIAYRFVKRLIVDECGIFGGDGSSCRDCSGVACGDKKVDLCEVCGGDGTSCLDCEGIPFGDKRIDQCGVCGGDGQSCLDCAGKPFGDAQLDQCGVCGGDGSSCLDCRGDAFGNARLDQCNVCGGDGTSCLDCNGSVFGSARLDQCGICGGDGTSCLDCAGAPFGTEILDDCGVCGGDGTSCLDCAGTVNGTALLDRCGVCSGDGTSCLECTAADHTEILFQLDGAGAALKHLARREVKLIRHNMKNARKAKRITNDLLRQADELFLSGWEVVWSMPSTSMSCNNNVFCTEVSNFEVKQTFAENTERFVKLIKRYSRKVRGNISVQNASKRIRNAANRIQRETQTALQDIPESTLSCDDR